jgi:hypothetical protein
MPAKAWNWLKNWGVAAVASGVSRVRWTILEERVAGDVHRAERGSLESVLWLGAWRESVAAFVHSYEWQLAAQGREGTGNHKYPWGKTKDAEKHPKTVTEQGGSERGETGALLGHLLVL